MSLYLVTYRVAAEKMSQCLAAAGRAFGACCIGIEPGLFFLVAGKHAQAVEDDIVAAFGCPIDFLFVTQVPSDHAVRYSAMMGDLQTRLDSVLPPH